MKLASFRAGGRASYGIVDPEAETIRDLGAVWGQLPTLRDAIAAGALGAEAEGVEAPVLGFGEIVFDLPIPNPSKFLLAGRNYADHVAEGANKTLPVHPGLFMRALNSLVPHQGAMVRPRISNGSFDYEGEMAFIIGKPGRYVGRDSALEHVFGYTCFNDGSERDFQARLQVIVGKNFPSTGGFGPWITTADEIGDPSSMTICTRVNGVEVQRSPLTKMIFDVPAIISYISDFNPLVPGDVVATGTPEGVGRARTPQLWLKPGDTVEVELTGVGTLVNSVVDE